MKAQTQEIVEAKEPVATSVSIVDIIERAVTNPDVDADKMQKLLEMRMTVMEMEAAQNYAMSMNAAQSEMGLISQDAANKQAHSKYASYAALDKALRPIYTRHGLSISFGTSNDAPDGHVRVMARIRHNSGHMETEFLDIPNNGEDAEGGDVMTKTHAQMSGVSYGRRGLLKMIFNIAEGDDDGNRASAGELITEDQCKKILTRLEATGSNIEIFCKLLKIPSIAEMPQAKHSAAGAMLDKKEKQIG